MCGIAGIWHPDTRPGDFAALRRMTAALTHRGPDDEGHHFEPGISLGHRRLSVIDLEGGHQPLSNENDSVWVTFNGEIFNYVELRERLEKRGHRFKTHSDTEVLVHLYEEKGLDFVDDLNGQFALALWDSSRRRLVLARDRVGIRPLFYAVMRDGSVLFASEIKAILAHGAVSAEIDPAAIGQICTFWVAVPPRTAFKGIAELPAGRMLVLENGRRTERRYWRHCFPRPHEYEERTLDYWTQCVRELLADAVRLQLRADVPVAAYLSGGLDSYVLSALIDRGHAGRLTTFSVAFADARFDEREHQHAAIERLRTDHHQIEVDDAAIGKCFADLIWAAERPLTRTAPAPLLLLAGAVREAGIKVVMTGEGADEIFAGYNLFREDKVRRFWARNPESRWRSGPLSRLYGYVERDAKGEAFWRLFFKAGLENVSDPYYSHRLRWQNGQQTKRFFSESFREQMQDEPGLFEELEAYLDPERAAWHPLCRAQYLEMTLFMSCYLLSAQADRVMMAHSVEGRVPFLDHRLIELAARIPPKFKLRGLREKYVLKRAFRDLVPARVARRPKQPYRAPIAACFVGRNAADLGAPLLEPEALAEKGIADVRAVEALVRKARTEDYRLREREEMALATVTSVQLLHQLFVTERRPLRSVTAA